MQRRDEPRNRVVRRRPRAVRRNSLYRQPLPERSLLGDPDPEVLDLSRAVDLVVTTFGDQKLDVAQQLRMSIDEHYRARGSNLLIGVGDVDDVAVQNHSRPPDREHRHEMGNPLTLHVESATTPQIAVLHDARVWVHRPVRGCRRYDVDVVHQRYRLL